MPVCTIQYFLFQFGTLHIFMQYPPFASICSLLHSHYSLLVHIYDKASTQLFVCMVNISINVCNAWPLSLSLCTPASHFKLLFVALSPQFYATFVLPFKHPNCTQLPYCACMSIYKECCKCSSINGLVFFGVFFLLAHVDFSSLIA